MEEVVEIGPELFEDRAVETVAMVEVSTDLGGGTLAHDDMAGIPWQQPGDHEHEHQDAEEHRDRDQDSPKDELEHAVCSVLGD